MFHHTVVGSNLFWNVHLIKPSVIRTNNCVVTSQDTIDRDEKILEWIITTTSTCRALKMRVKITNVIEFDFWRYNISCSRFSRCQIWTMIGQIVFTHESVWLLQITQLFNVSKLQKWCTASFTTLLKIVHAKLRKLMFKIRKIKLRLYLWSRIWILNFRSIAMLTHTT